MKLSTTGVPTIIHCVASMASSNRFGSVKNLDNIVDGTVLLSNSSTQQRNSSPHADLVLW